MTFFWGKQRKKTFKLSVSVFFMQWHIPHSLSSLKSVAKFVRSELKWIIQSLSKFATSLMNLKDLKYSVLWITVVIKVILCPFWMLTSSITIKWKIQTNRLFKISPFVFRKRKKVIQGWSNMRMIKLTELSLFFPENYPFKWLYSYTLKCKDLRLLRNSPSYSCCVHHYILQFAVHN